MAGKKVLVVDDKALMRDTLKAVFQSRGASVLLAGSGEEGWKTYQANKADIGMVVTDCRMDDGARAGIELGEKIKNDNPAVILALHTAEYFEREEASKLAPVFNRILKKPADLDEFYDLLEMMEKPPAPKTAPFTAGKKTDWSAEPKGEANDKTPPFS